MNPSARHNLGPSRLGPYLLSRCLLGLFLTTIAFGALPAHGQNGGDRLFVALGDELWSTELPRSEPEELLALQEPPDAIAYGPDGNLWALAFHNPTVLAPPPYLSLYTIGADGESIPMAVAEIHSFIRILDMAFDPEGRLFVLVYGTGIADPPTPSKILYELDPDTGDAIGIDYLPIEVEAIATSARGLWLLGYDRLLHFDPSNGGIKDSGFFFESSGNITAAATDSTGALWFISRPGNIDPVRMPFGPLAIEQRCQSTDTARCLLGGRFRVTTTWRDFEDRTDFGRVVPRGSADSALFYFFEPSNFEVLLKVIDGCKENGHFWVFAAGTTNVGYDIRVTDLLTDETFLWVNPLGQISPAVTETLAFATCDR